MAEEGTLKAYNKEDVPPPADASGVIKRHGGGLPDHSVEGEAGHGRDGHALGPRLQVEDLGWDDPREGTTRGGEAEVVQPGHGDEAPRRTAVAVFRPGRELGEEDGGDDEGDHVAHVAQDERPAAAGLVDEQHAAELRDESQHGRDGLVLEGLILRDADLGVNRHGIILDGRHTRHLDTRLDAAGEQQPAERRLVPEQLDVRLGRALVLHRYGLLDLLELGAHPRVGHVAVRVQLGERLEALVHLAVVDKPARGLWEEEDEHGQDAGGDDLDAEGDAPLAVVGGVEADEGAPRDPGGGEGADAQHELLEGGDSAADAGVAELGLV